MIKATRSDIERMVWQALDACDLLTEVDPEDVVSTVLSETDLDDWALVQGQPVHADERVDAQWFWDLVAAILSEG